MQNLDSGKTNNPRLRPLPKIFILELTWRCNNKCLYCYTIWGAPIYSQGSKYEMSTKEIKEVIIRLQEEVHCELLGISGGEPLLREDLLEILSFIWERGINTVIITNGTLLANELVTVTTNDKNIYEVTLLSYRHDIHDQLTGHKGAWYATIDGMANINKAGGRFVAVFVATKLNYMDLYKTAELAIALGATGLMYNRINLGTYNIRDADKLLPTPEMVKENLDVLEEVGETYGLPISISVIIEPCLVDLSKYKYINFAWCPLAGENSYFAIDPAGNIRICNHSPIILGNINRDSFKQIYYNHPYINTFRDTWPHECICCNHQMKNLCCGGCKAAAEQCYGTLAQVDPFATLSNNLR